MARDGAGNYTMPYPDFVAGTTIESQKVDDNNADLAAAMTQSLSKDGQTVPTGNQPMGGFKHTGVAAASARTDYARTDQVQDNAFASVLTTGDDAIVAVLTPLVTVAKLGQRFTLKKNANANTGAVTLNVGPGAGPVKWPNGDALAAADLPANCSFEVTVQDITTPAAPVFHLQTVSSLPFMRPTLLTTKGDTLIVNGASISAITQASPGVVTTTLAHGLTTGDSGKFESVGGMTQLNGRTAAVTVLSPTTYSIGIDTSAFTAYTSGGTLLVVRRRAVGSNGSIVMARSASPIGMADVSPFSGHINGLTYSNNGTDATNDIDIAAGGCMDATNAFWIALSAITKRLDATWSVGTNQGGLDTGSIANADYFIWAIARSDTGVTDVLFSASATSPTMPADYDFKRRIGWFKRESAAITAFKTYELPGGGLDFYWVVPTLDVSLADTLTTTGRTDAIKVPLAFSTIAKINALISDAAAACLVWIYNPDQTSAAPSELAGPLANMALVTGSGIFDQRELRIRTSATGTIGARSNLATVDFYKVSTIGFEWSRR